MKPQDYIVLFVLGLIGQAIHLCLKVATVQKAAHVANVKFDFKVFLNDEMFAILTTVFGLIAMLFVIEEVLALKPEIISYLRITFLFVGYTGSSLIVALLGKASDKLNRIIDVKSNIADDVAPNTPPDPKV